MKPLTWETLDWDALNRLRETFLAAQPGIGVYWTSLEDVANYDFTYAQRIGWKWDAVLNELKHRGWRPSGGVLLDWGCGSGIASRCVLHAFGADAFTGLNVSDHSGHAVQFAARAAQAAFPNLPVSTGLGEGRIGTLVISHVLNELDEAGGRALREAIDRADSILWVEPGTYADSRSLIRMREALRADFHVIAPCTHQAPCGMTIPENERHWCHHFAEPPSGIMADSDWVRFAQRAGIDLRSLPYSFLALERRGVRAKVPGLIEAGWSRVIGEPRVYKGYARALCCEAASVCELELQKRDGPAVFKAMKHGDSPRLLRGEHDGKRFTVLHEAKEITDDPTVE